MVKVKMIIHGRSNVISKLQRMAKANSEDIDVVLTENALHAQSLAETSDGYDLVISCGGDGTNNHIVNGLDRKSVV